MSTTYTLYCSNTSPYSRKVRILIEEYGIKDKVALINPAVDKFANPNSLGKIPALLTPDLGLVVDSPVICSYLESVHGNGTMYPKSHKEKYQVLVIEAIGDGICDAAVAILLERRKPVEKQTQETIEAQSLKVTESLKELQNRLPHFSSGFNFASVVVASAMDYVKFRAAELFSTTEYAQLEAWYATISKRPSISSTLPG